MKYLITKMATDWPAPSKTNRILRRIFFFIPDANRDYKNWHLINRWLVEFTETNGELLPWREIALDENNNPIFAGPDRRNYGYWLDTNMTYSDFEGDEIKKHKFEKYWEMTGVIEP